MNCEKAITSLINIIYSSTQTPVYSQEEIDLINDFYKNNFQKCATLSDFKSLDGVVDKLIMREPAVSAEIESKISIKKALQPGVISECNFSSTLAGILGLTKRTILRGVSDIPDDIRTIANDKSINIEKCRYIYYGDNMDSILFQFGDPLSCDAMLLYEGETINIEYKERMAKAGEYDLIHDENGKLYIPKNLTINRPELIPSIQPMVDEFNRKTSLWDCLGSNFKSFSNTTRIMAICGYFNSKRIDVLISTDINGEIVAIISKWIDLNYSEEEGGGFSVISADGSEIRTTGRNPHDILCLDHFKKVFKNNGGHIDNDKCEIKETGGILKIAKSRGIGRASKLKINNIYEVPFRDKGYGCAHKVGDKWVFDIKSVKQKLPTVSPHITIIASREEIINNLLKYINYVKTVKKDINTNVSIDRANNGAQENKQNFTNGPSNKKIIQSPFFGKGYIIGFNEKKDRIVVKFHAGEKTFMYPDAFEQGYLKRLN